MRALLLVAAVLLSAACITPQRAARASARFELGVAYFKEGSVELSLAALRDAAELDPTAWKPWNTLGVVYIAKGERELAEDAFKRALRMAPDEAEILNNYGTLLVDLGRNDEAIASLEKALDDLEYRNIAMIQSNLSFALLRAGRSEDALRYAREATRRAPTMCRAWYNLGLVQESRKDSLAALEAYNEALEACPNDAMGARLRTGCLQVETGLDDGVSMLEGIVSASPGTTYADEARACLRVAGR